MNVSGEKKMRKAKMCLFSTKCINIFAKVSIISKHLQQ